MEYSTSKTWCHCGSRAATQKSVVILRLDRSIQTILNFSALDPLVKPEDDSSGVAGQARNDKAVARNIRA
jgi:hypothetical protein